MVFLGLSFPVPTWNPGVPSAPRPRSLTACLNLAVLFPARNVYLEKRIVWDKWLEVVGNV